MSAGAPEAASSADVHPVARNALRLCLSAKEYKLLHDFAVKHAPPAALNKLPPPSRYEAIVRSKNKHNVAAVRASLRVFLGTGAALGLADMIASRIRKDASNGQRQVHSSILRSPNFRLSLSLSLVLLIHRFLHRFLVKLRANLRTDDARPFRERNPRISKALTSRYAPAIGSSVAGFALGISPQVQLRMSVAIYATTKSLEYLYNVLDEKGWLGQKPAWFGSWLLMPISCAQLFHAFVFDRDTTPKWLGKVIIKLSPSYIRGRPEAFPSNRHWPDEYETVDSLATISQLRWPPFISPILQPFNEKTLPDPVKSLSPITGPAHPSISSLSCAVLHPDVPNCTTAFLHHILLSVPPLARILTLVTFIYSFKKLKPFLYRPIATTNEFSKRVISLTAVLSTAVGSAWGSLCLWNILFSRSTLPTKRFFLSGALGGLPFAFLDGSRGVYLSVFRTAVDSAWKVGAKRGTGKSLRGGELWVVVVAWALIGAILDSRPSAVDSRGLRKALAWLRGDGFVDPIEVAAAKRKAKKAAASK